MNSTQLTSLYRDTKAAIRRKQLSRLKRILQQNTGESKAVKLYAFRDAISRQRHAMYETRSDNSGSYYEDAYIKALLREFEQRKRNYERDHIQLFFKNDFKPLKKAFAKRLQEICKPHVFKMGIKDTILFIAEHNALERLHRDCDRIQPEAGQTVEYILERIEQSEEDYKAQISAASVAPVQAGKVQWKGDVEVAFVQLVYGLFEAGLLDNESHQVTRLVEDVAKLWNIELGIHWQSNHSKSVRKNKHGYAPSIFTEAGEAYEKHRSEKRNSK